jgi:hypothetical protein
MSRRSSARTCGVSTFESASVQFSKIANTQPRFETTTDSSRSISMGKHHLQPLRPEKFYILGTTAT